MILVEGGAVIIASAVASIVWKIIKLPFLIIGGAVSFGMSIANWRNSRKALKQSQSTSHQIKRLTEELQHTQSGLNSQHQAPNYHIQDTNIDAKYIKSGLFHSIDNQRGGKNSKKKMLII